jgi:hypothetical protein
LLIAEKISFARDTLKNAQGIDEVELPDPRPYNVPFTAIRTSTGKRARSQMGYNRSGEARKQRLKRQKREVARLVAKLESKPAPKAAAAPAKKPAAKS